MRTHSVTRIFFITKQKLRFLLLTALLALITLLPVACDTNPDKTVRLAHISWPGYETLSLAQSENLYQGITVKYNRLSSNTEVARAFEQNIVDVVALTLNEAVEIQNRITEPVLIIAVLDISHGGDVIIAKKEITSIAGLKGKRLAMEPTALGAYIVSRALDSTNDLSMDDMHIVPITSERHYDFMMTNKVDAVATFEPTKSKLLKQASHVIFDSSLIPDEIVDVLITRASFANTHGEATRTLIAGHFKALQYTKDAPEKAVIKMAGFEDTSPGEFKQSLSGLRIASLNDNRRFLGGEKPGLLTTIKKLHQFMIDIKMIEAGHTSRISISDQFIPTEDLFK